MNGVRLRVPRLLLASWVIVGTSVAALVLTGEVAGADAPTGTSITATVTQTSTNTGRQVVTLEGTWRFTGERCASGGSTGRGEPSSRTGVGWSVNWWGIGTSSTGPSPFFDLYTATLVTTANSNGRGATKFTGTISEVENDLRIGSTSTFFYEGPNLDGYTTNKNAATCTDTGDSSTGPWKAEATYPSATKIPASVCVNFYDLHEFSSGTFTLTHNTDSTVQRDGGRNFDRAEDCFVVKATPTLDTTAGTGVMFGSSIADTANLSGGSTPSGTLTFTLYKTTCTTKVAAFTTHGVAVSGDGTYRSPSYDPTSIGTYLWAVSYSGNATNNAVTSLCGASHEEVTVAAVTAPVTTTPSVTGTVTLGSSSNKVHDTVSVAGKAGASAPTGTVTLFECFSPGSTAAATCGPTGATSTEQKTLAPQTSGGPVPHSTAETTTFTLDAAGEYCFGAVFTPSAGTTNYTSSHDNTASTTAVVTGECLTVAAVTAPVTPASAPPPPPPTPPTPPPPTPPTPPPPTPPTPPPPTPPTPQPTPPPPTPPPSPTPPVVPALSSVAAPSSGVAGLEGRFGDTLTVTGGNGRATGTVTFALYTADCRTVELGPSSSVELAGTGSAPTAGYVTTWVPPAPGTYYWKVTYSGDAAYKAAIDDAGCNVRAESVVIGAPPPPTKKSLPVTNPDFIVAMSDAPGDGLPVPAGATTSYTISVRNAGTASGYTVVSDALPSDLTLTAPEPHCAGATAADRCRVSVEGNAVVLNAYLPVGHAVDMVVAAVVSPADRRSVVNTAVVVSGLCTTCRATTVNAVIALGAHERSTPPDGPTVPPGTRVGYDVVLSDGGSGPASAVRVADVFPLGTGYVPGSGSCAGDGGCSVSGNGSSVTWTGVTVPPHGTVTLRFALTVSAIDRSGERISDVAVFTNEGTPGCTSPTCRTNTVTVAVGAVPALHLSRSLISPGQMTIATGVGCPAGAAVRLEVDGKVVGLTRADPSGSFTMSISPPNQLPGEETVTATCGSVRMHSTLSIVDNAKASSPAGSAGVFAVFVLLGGFLVKGQFPNAAAARRRRKKRPKGSGK